MALERDLEIVESPRAQGAGETKTYSLTVTPWGSSPTSPAVTVEKYVDATYTDVTADLTIGAPTVSGDVITFSLAGLSAGVRYRVTISFTCGSDVNTPFLWIDCVK